MSTALVREHEMVTRARGLLATQIDADPLVGRAWALVETVKGIVVTTEAESAAVADTAIALARGIAQVEQARKRILEIPREVEKAVNAHARSLLEPMRGAKMACDNATAGFLIRQRQEQERALAAEREQAQVDAAQEAAETGEETVALEAPAAVKPQTMVRGAAGTQGLVEVLKCSWDDPPPHPWATLNEVTAKAWFRVEVTAGRFPRPKLGEGFVLAKGVRFWVEASVATRQAR